MNLCTICFKTNHKEIVKSLLISSKLIDTIDIVEYQDNTELLNLTVSQKLVFLTNNDWIITFIDPSYCLEKNFISTLTRLSKQTDIFMVLTQSITGGLWFEYHQQGELKRQWIEVEGEILSNLGEPISYESSFITKESYERNEWELFDMIKQVTGFDLNEIL